MNASITAKATPTEDHVTAINQMFTEFQLAYHNQFHKAFSDDQKIAMAKQLWVKTLCDLSPERIVYGTRQAIKESEYLPTLHTIRQFCAPKPEAVSYTHLRAHETGAYLVCRLLLEKKKN